MKYLIPLNKSEYDLVSGGWDICTYGTYDNYICTCQRKTGHQDGSINSSTSTAGIVTMAVGGGLFLIGILSYAIAAKMEKTAGYTKI